MHGSGTKILAPFSFLRLLACLLAMAYAMVCVGCYAPVHSPGVAASCLPDEFRIPSRSCGIPLNYASLVQPPPQVYRLGPGDLLEVTVPNLFPGSESQPFSAQVQDTGEISLPYVGAIRVVGLSVIRAQARINAVLADGMLVNPSATVRVIDRGTVSVLVLGEVANPGVHPLPRYENDVGHALAAAGGFTEYADQAIEVHRRPDWNPVAASEVSMSNFTGGRSRAFFASSSQPPNPALPNSSLVRLPPIDGDRVAHGQREDETSVLSPVPSPPMEYKFAQPPVVRIPLRAVCGYEFSPDAVVLNQGDVIVVPRKTDEVFYVVGRLDRDQAVRFSISERDRQLGNGFLLPVDRDIDVVTAVSMAGYIDPIESPTTVTLHRIMPNGLPLLVHVDLIKARKDPRETLFVQGGDIIYLNPDPWWYSRYTVDRIIDRALGTAVGRWLTN